MKHIEFSSKPWNNVPSRYGTLFESAVAVLKSSLGIRWPISLSAILLVVFLPVPVVFLWQGIKLDPPLFVTEWLKLSIEGILFFFILEIVRHRSLSFTAHQLLVSFLATNYVIPLQGMIESLTQFSESLKGKSPADPILMITSARHNWTNVKYALSDAALSHISANGETTIWLLNNRNSLDIRKCDAILSSLSSVQHIENLNQREFDELYGRLNAFLESARTFSVKS